MQKCTNTTTEPRPVRARHEAGVSRGIGGVTGAGVAPIMT